MKKAVFTFVLMLLAVSVYPQETSKDQIIVIGSASVEVPADIIKIVITLTFKDNVDGQTAYEMHKAAESKLIDILKEETIHDSLITYSLLSMYTDYYRDLPAKYTTIQTITVALYDFTKYASLQLKLVEDGFIVLNQSFESTKSLEAVDEAIQKAVISAKHKADLICKASGRKIKKISKISDTEDTEPIIQRYFPSRGRGSANTTIALIDIPQTVNIQKQVKVVFELE